MRIGCEDCARATADRARRPASGRNFERMVLLRGDEQTSSVYRRRSAYLSQRRCARWYTPAMPQGFFITFEGLDGSGKSTQVRKLTQWLEQRGERVVATRQPGGTAFGDRVRALLLDSRGAALSPNSELGLMFSDRAQCI